MKDRKRVNRYPKMEIFMQHTNVSVIIYLCSISYLCQFLCDKMKEILADLLGTIYIEFSSSDTDIGAVSGIVTESMYESTRSDISFYHRQITMNNFSYDNFFSSF